ncbi:MAG TPA: MBL fold metallo-hydrolase [Candidatus Paceibacterota bacterium]
MNMRKPYVLAPFIVVLLLLNGWLTYLILIPREEKLEVHFLDIGQGDSILIEAPGGIDMLIDGGPDRSVMRQLPKKIGIFDRKIDVVIATHPDKDHIAGLPAVFSRYQVSYFIESGVEHDSQYVEALEEAVSSEPSLTVLTARRGMRIRLGEEAYADILFPDRDVSNVETNDGSVILRLVYGDTSFVLAGDAPSKLEDYLVSLDGSALNSDVLKASHHGSKNSTSDTWLQAVDSSIVVISAGRGNSYGHPAPDVVTRILNSGARIYSTIEDGTVTIISDGEEVWMK